MNNRERTPGSLEWDTGKLARSLANSQAEKCLFGLFDSSAHLAAVPWSVDAEGHVEAAASRAAYDLLYGAPLAGITDYHGAACHMLVMDEPLLGGITLRAILMRGESKGPFEAHLGRVAREALHALDVRNLLEMIASSPGVIAAKRRHDVRWAMMLLDSELTVQLGWWSPKGHDLFYEPGGKSLPKFIEVPLRRFVADWNWTNASTCADGAFSPVPDVIVRVVPAQGPSAVCAMLVVEHLQVRVALDNAKREHRISPRESEVLQLLLEGYRVSEIAEALSVAESTVQDHIKRAISKTGSRNRVQMAARLLGWSLHTDRRPER